MDDDCEPESIEDVLDCVEEAGGEAKRVSVADIVDRVGAEAFAPLLLVPALMMVSPATAVFGVATFCGVLVALISIQMVVGRERLWLPRFILDRTISNKRLDSVTGWLARPARFVDGLMRQRLTLLIEPPMTRLWALVCLLLALVVPVFEMVPMSATIIGAAISAFALAMVAKDGLFVLLGLAVVSAALWLGWSVAT